MANRSAVDEDALSSNSQDHNIRFDADGPGRLLHQTFSVLGGAVEAILGLVAHQLGFGPVATSRRIEEAFGDNIFTRQSRLDSIYDSLRENQRTTTQNRFLCTLQKDCQKLLEYALPSESLENQKKTFWCIIVLTTRYPGLGRIFLQSFDADTVPCSLNAILECWKGTDRYDKDTLFTLHFAAHCLAGSNIDLEGIRPSELGYACVRIVDALLERNCDEISPLSRPVAIRYLAGILELPAFWIEGYELQKFTMDKLCQQVLRLLENTSSTVILRDPDGVDALADAVLVGGRRWIQRRPRIKGLGFDPWLINFIKLIEMLRGPFIPRLLPIASRRAAGNWEALLEDITDGLPMPSYVYAFVHSQMHSSVAEELESVTADVERPSPQKDIELEESRNIIRNLNHIEAVTIGENKFPTLETKYAQNRDSLQLPDSDTASITEGGNSIQGFSPSREVVDNSTERPSPANRADSNTRVPLQSNAETVDMGNAERSMEPTQAPQPKGYLDSESDNDSDSSDADGYGVNVFNGSVSSSYVRGARGAGNATSLEMVTYTGTNRNTNSRHSQSRTGSYKEQDFDMDSLTEDISPGMKKLIASSSGSGPSVDRAQSQAGRGSCPELEFDMDLLVKEFQNLSPEMKKYIRQVGEKV